MVCGDRDCCLHGLEDMTENWRAHFLYQRFNRLLALEQVPDHNGARRFLDNDMAQADRLARQVKNLKIGNDKLAKRLTDHSRRIEARRTVLESLYEAWGDGAPRAPKAIVRGAGTAQDQLDEV